LRCVFVGFEHTGNRKVFEAWERAHAFQLSLKWVNVQAVLLDVCIAFHPLDLPPYVILEIVDHFPVWKTHVNRKKKIDYIIQIKKFCDNLIKKRVKQANDNKRRSTRIQSQPKK
jgi:hypothetical protein